MIGLSGEQFMASFFLGLLCLAAIGYGVVWVVCETMTIIKKGLKKWKQ